MKINAGLDTGDMLLKWQTSIELDETAPKLGDRLAEAGAQLLIETLARLDTILIEPDLGHCTLTWRYTRPLVNDLFEIAQVLVGNQNKTWWLARHEAQLPGSESASELEPA